MFISRRPLAAVIAALVIEAAILGANWVYGLSSASATAASEDAPGTPFLDGAERNAGDDRPDAAVLQARNPLLQHQPRIDKGDDGIGTDQRRDD